MRHDIKILYSLNKLSKSWVVERNPEVMFYVVILWFYSRDNHRYTPTYKLIGGIRVVSG